jgi:hypothetical protein
MKIFMNSLCSFLETLGAGVWVGALATFGYAVAAPVFRNLPSVTQAGQITALVLHRINQMEAVSAGMMVLAAVVFLLQKEHRTPLRIAKSVIVGLMTAAFLYYGVGMMNRMEHLRTAEIKNFDQVEESTRAARDEFDRLHKRYTRLAGANIFLGLGFLLLSGCERKNSLVR